MLHIYFILFYLVIYLLGPGAAARAEPEPTPPRRAKQQVVELSDSDEDAGVEMQEDAKPKKQPAQLKRLRRAVKEDSDEDEDMPEVVQPKAKKEVKKEVKKEAKKEAKKEVRSGAGPPADDDSETFVKQEGALRKVPAPCSGCLDGKTFAFSGVLENLSREDAVHLVKSCGGSVANSVTRATKFLVIGATLEQGGNVADGSKYKEAVSKNVRILTQNEFYNLITEAGAAQQAQDLAAEKAKAKAEAAGAKSASSKGKQKLNTCVGTWFLAQLVNVCDTD
ncbi:unnamed protein product [Phytophthora fragariaefolia]|uniref:Unnamed protein product n=1 Tax=Phytophthora fragariaefolia TaxID=1490495 RepID=A0A9W6UAZ0_9STRA|nr:unnamed protein product [Phytophthora fragariaefolia]